MKHILCAALLLCGSHLFSQDTAVWLVPMGKYENIISWNQYFIVNENGHWGMVDQKLKTIIPLKYNRIEAMCHWAVALQENEKWGFRHLKDLRKWAVQPIYEDWGWGPGSKRNRGYAHSWILHVGEKEWAITITKEKIVVEEPGKRALSVEQIRDEEEDDEAENPPARLPQPMTTRPWHSQWKTVEPMHDIYDEDNINPGTDVFDVMDQAEKHGMTDVQGNILIPVRYDRLRIINSQTIIAKEGNEYGKPTYFSFFRRSDGKRMSKETYTKFDRARSKTDMNIQVWQPPSEELNFFRCGLLNAAGEELIPCMYAAFAEEPPPGFIPAKLYGHWGIINTKNKMLLSFNYDDISLPERKNSSLLLVSKGREIGLVQIK